MSTQLLASIIAACARMLARPTVRWIGSRPGRRQRVYFANHTSHLDFVVLWSVLPHDMRRRTRPVAAQDYWNTGLRRRIAVGVFHAVLVDRGAQSASRSRGITGQFNAVRHSLRLLVEALNKHYSLIVFPEGTRGSGEGVAAFKSGIYYLWRQRPDVEYIPVHLSNLNRILPKGGILPMPVISHVVFGPPLQPEANESKESFLARAHNALEELGRT